MGALYLMMINYTEIISQGMGCTKWVWVGIAILSRVVNEEGSI